jgi:phage major head subunit gpT-like protein
MSESTFAFSVDTFGRMLTLDRRDIINDDMGLFNDNSKAFGRAAARSVSDLVYSTLMANAGSFFAAGNGNFDDGTDSILSSDSLSAAIAAIIAQRDGDGNDLDIIPKTLVVPPELTEAGKQLLESDYIQRANNDLPTGNTLKGALKLETEPRLSNTTRFSTASIKHWYVFAAPSDAPMIVAFLQGIQSPTVEFFGLESNVNTLAASWRVYFDYGAALGDFRAAYRMKGEA